MNEDLKITIGADLKKIEKDIKNLEKIEPKINIDTILKIRNKNEKIKEIKQLQKEIQLVKLNPGAFSDNELKKLNQQLKQAKEELKSMKAISSKSLFKETYDEAKKLNEKVKEIKLDPKSFQSEDIKILRSEIEATVLKAKAINFTDGNSKTQGLINNLKNSSKELDKITEQVGYTNKTFKTMDIIVGNLAANLVTKVLGSLKQLTIEGAKFNQQMEFATEKIRTISSSGNLEINSNIWRIAKETGVNPLELKEGLYQTVSAIGDIHKKYALLETANKLATTGFSTSVEAVDGLTTVLNAYNLGVEEADRIANIFVRTQKVGKLTVQEFNRELYKTIPVAKELKIGVDEVGASIALLTAKGSKAEVAQTQMGAFMYELLEMGSDISKLFEKIAGQSLDHFMNNGGNFEGVLRLLKGYSDTNNFKIESLLGRKEAKSFWLNVGKDIDGYIEKLNAINDPVNELQRNFENLLNTQEKRLARASNYWLAFKQIIGEVSGEILASIGDFITGADTETAARQRLNNELANNLKSLEELSKKQSLTKDEQNTLNTALESLTILAPNVAEAYRNWSVNGGSYAEVLKEIHKAQLEVNKEHSNMTLKSFDKELAQLEKEYKKIENKLYKGKNKTVHQKDYSLVGKIKDGRISKEKTPEEYSRVKELIYMKNLLFNKIKSKKKERSLYLEKLENKTEALTENPSSKEKIEEKKSRSKEINGNFTNWDSKYKELEAKKQQDLIEAKKNYIKDLSLATEDTRIRVDEDYQYKIAQIEDDTKIAKLELEINELKAKIENSTDSNTINNIKSQIDSKVIEKEDIKTNASLRELENIKNQEKLKKIEEEKQFKIDEQNTKNDFNEKRIEIEKKYQENLKGMENSFSQERYNRLKEEREKELALININEKISLLKLRKKRLDQKKDSSEIKAIDNEIEATQLNFDTSKLDDETKKRIENFQESISSVTRNLNNLSKAFEATGNKTASNVMKGASAILDTVGNLSPEFINKIHTSLGFKGDFKNSKLGQALTDVGNGITIGSTIDSLISGGSKEGQIGSIAGAAIGTAVGGPIGAVVGSSIGGSIGGVFGKKKKKKTKKEKKKYEEAQKRLEQGRISGQYNFQETMEAFNEELEKSGLANKIHLFENVSKNTNYDSIKTALQGGAVGPDGVRISVLKELMPHMTEQEIFDWFKSTTGGAVINGDAISTGEGKYGAINLGALAEQITQMNRELENSLKETIKNIIDFSAEKISSVVKNGFGDGINDLGENLEKTIANSLKNAFLQTEIAKNLFNGFSDKVTKIITDMFKNDKNLGINIEVGKLEDLTLQEYINLIKKYMELGNERLSDIFKELGLSLDNLNNTIEKANKNSKNTVQGMPTNLWLQNLSKSNSEVFKTFISSNSNAFKLMSENQKIISNNTIHKISTLNLEKTLKNLKIDLSDINTTNEFKLYLDGKALDAKIFKVLQSQTIKNNRNKLSIIRG